MGRGRTLPLIASVALGLTLLVRLALVLDRLPEQVASHYDFAGRPDGYQSKFEFVCTATLLDLLMLGLVCVLPALIPRVPLRMVNLPHKAYWFAPNGARRPKGVWWSGSAGSAVRPSRCCAASSSSSSAPTCKRAR